MTKRGPHVHAIPLILLNYTLYLNSEVDFYSKISNSFADTISLVEDLTWFDTSYQNESINTTNYGYKYKSQTQLALTYQTGQSCQT